MLRKKALSSDGCSHCRYGSEAKPSLERPEDREMDVWENFGVFVFWFGSYDLVKVQ